MSKGFLSFIFLLLCTVVALLWSQIDTKLLHFLSVFYSYLMQQAQPFINDHLIRQILVVVLVSLALALIPAFIYWIMHRRWFNGYMTVAWCAWLVLMTMIIVRQGYLA